MAQKNPHFRLPLKGGRKYQVMVIDYRKNPPEKTPFGEEFFGRDEQAIYSLWEDLCSSRGKTHIGYEIRRIKPS